MKGGEFIRMALEALKGNKLRSFLTLLGMIIGVLAIISSVTAVKVIDVYFNDTINFLGSSSFTVQKTPGVNFGRPDRSIRMRKDITYEQIERLKDRVKLPLAVSPSEDFKGSAIAKFGQRETDPNVSLSGTDQNFALNSAYDIATGRFLTDQDVQYARPVVVIGATLKETLFPNESALGKEIRIDGHRFKVIGVTAEKGEAFGQDMDNFAVGPITRLFAIYGSAGRSLSIDIRASSTEMLAATMDEVTGALRAIRKVEPGQDNDFEIITNDSLVDAFTSFTPFLTMGGVAIGFISLLTAGIGIMNIMLVSVTERTKEIGIRKAIGAKSGDILKQFIWEAIFLCQIGGILGILAGALVGNLLAFQFDIRATFPWNWAIGGVLGVTIIALIFGVYPAHKASKLDPIESLRFE